MRVDQSALIGREKMKIFRQKVPTEGGVKLTS